jgi:microcystin-dependent protein
LFALIEYTYGGSGGNFNVPDLRFKVAAGSGYGTGTWAMGATGGNDNTGVRHRHGQPTHTHGYSHTHAYSHTHELVHTHTINHDHPQVTTSGNNHVYDDTVGVDLTPGSGSFQIPSSLNDVDNHTHTANVPNYTGNSGGANDATTDSQSSSTTTGQSATTTGAGGGDNTEYAGVGSSDTVGNWPPFLAVNMVIKL